jgi:3-oxoacyl-[acyl-carrier-protein] synthase-3
MAQQERKMWNLDFAVALPDHRVSAAQIAEWTGGDEAFIKNKVGIDSRRFLGPDERPLDLARQAAEAGLTKSGLAATDLDWLLFVTQNPDFRLPQSSALLADAIGAKSGIAAFDVSLGCSGWVYALALADAFAGREDFEAGMIVTCDPYSRGMLRTDKSTMTVFGDAAAATVFRAGGPVTIGRGVYGTDGANGMKLCATAGGSRHPVASVHTDGSGRATAVDEFRIQMDGRAILDFMQARVPVAVEDCLGRNHLTVADIDYFVFHQASKFMLQLLIRRMDLDPEKVPIEVADTGNTVSSSIPLVLDRLADRGQLGGTILVCGFGVGLSWAANILRF